MSEKARIQQQLAEMREHCLRDYLQDKLQAIVSKEVVNDILNAFVEANNSEFLESVAESIVESKETIKHLRESIGHMRREEEAAVGRERERVREECKQEHYLEMSVLKEELRCIKDNL
jgi:hypothetical protein